MGHAKSRPGVQWMRRQPRGPNFAVLIRFLLTHSPTQVQPDNLQLDTIVPRQRNERERDAARGLPVDATADRSEPIPRRETDTSRQALFRLSGADSPNRCRLRKNERASAMSIGEQPFAGTEACQSGGLGIAGNPPGRIDDHADAQADQLGFGRL